MPAKRPGARGCLAVRFPLVLSVCQCLNPDMPKAYPAELREVVKAMFLSGVRPETIAAENSLSVAIVHKWASRYKWTTARDKAKTVIRKTGEASLARQAAADIGAASANVRASLAGALEKQAAALAATEPKAADLANTRERQGAAAVAKTIAEAAEKVFQWGEASRPGLVLSVKLGADILSKPATGSVIDLQPEAESANPLQLQAGQLNATNIVRNNPAPAAGEPGQSIPEPGAAPAASPGPEPGA